MKKLWEDFKKFIKRGNVVDMAVGVAVASAFTAIVTAFTKGFINPLLALISKTSNQEELKWIIRPAIEETLEDGTVNVIQTEVAFLWGPFVQAIINFFVVALTLFIVMRVVAAVSKRAQKLASEISGEAEKLAEAEAKAKEEAEVKAKAEAEAAEAAAKVAAEKAAAEAAKAKAEAEEALNREKREEQLLVEIRDLLKTLNSK